MTENKHTDTGASQPSSEVQQLQARVAYLEARMVKAGEKEPALAAHAERLKERARLITDRRQWEGSEDPRIPHVLLDKLSEACMDSPETSLARRDLLKQAEVLEVHAEFFEAKTGMAECEQSRQAYSSAAKRLNKYADELRRQAEEPRS